MLFSTSAIGLVTLLICSPLAWTSPVSSDLAGIAARGDAPPALAERSTTGRTIMVKRSYAQTCTLCGLGSNNILIFRCLCRRADGRQAVAAIDLNTCLINSDGRLRWLRNGGFGASCAGYSLDGTIFSANCPNNIGKWSRSSINLDERIHNFNGVLGCGV